MKRSQITSVLTVLAGLALATGPAFAQSAPATAPATATPTANAESATSDGHGENEHREDRHRPDMLAHLSHFLAPLNLTAAQQSQLAAIVATESPKFDELRKTQHDSMMALLKSDPADAQAVAQAAQIIGDNAKQTVLEVGSLRASLAHLLTPAQQTQLTAKKLNWLCAGLLMGGEGHKGFHGHMGDMMHHHKHAETDDAPATH